MRNGVSSSGTIHPPSPAALRQGWAWLSWGWTRSRVLGGLGAQARASSSHGLTFTGKLSGDPGKRGQRGEGMASISQHYPDSPTTQGKELLG